MYYSRKRPLEEVREEMTAIWACPQDDCNGWMRANFAFSTTPVCSLCQSEMVKSEKMLAVVVNNSPIQGNE
ncbi:cold-shock protein [Cohnella sp. GCM10027633]